MTKTIPPKNEIIPPSTTVGQAIPPSGDRGLPPVADFAERSKDAADKHLNDRTDGTGPDFSDARGPSLRERLDAAAHRTELNAAADPTPNVDPSKHTLVRTGAEYGNVEPTNPNDPVTVYDVLQDNGEPDAPLSPAELHALDELAQEAYSKYTDHLLETSQLAPAQWTGLNESTKQAWRRVVSHVKAAV